MKVEVAILGSPSLISLMVSVDVKQHLEEIAELRAQELCESRGGCPGLPVPNSLYGLCGCKATLNLNIASELRSCVKVEVAVLGPPSQIVLMVSVDVKRH